MEDSHERRIIEIPRNNCGVEGHFARECRVRGRKEQDVGQVTVETVIMDNPIISRPV